MQNLHVIINTVPFRERLHANPTNMCLAYDASNMIAAFVALYRSLASRAVFDAVTLRPLLE